MVVVVRGSDGLVALCVGLAWVVVRLAVVPRRNQMRTRILARPLGEFVASLCERAVRVLCSSSDKL